MDYTKMKVKEMEVKKMTLYEYRSEEAREQLTLESITKKYGINHTTAFNTYNYESSKLLARVKHGESFIHVPGNTFAILDRYYRLAKYQATRGV